MIQDWKYPLRSLAKHPGMTMTALLTLALGIGVNTLLFTVVNTVLLRPMNYAEPDRIVSLYRLWPGNVRGIAVTTAKFDFWRRNNHSFDAVAAINMFPVGFNLKEPDGQNASSVLQFHRTSFESWA
jgi:putative ABC transport system permease protein